jgi:hypothetical protein
MSRAAAVLAALTEEPASTSELYDRVGYRTLVRVGLVPYQEFRAELVRLAASGMADGDLTAEGATMWRLPRPEEDEPVPPAA